VSSPNNLFSYASINSSNFSKTELRSSRCTSFSSSFNVGLVFGLIRSSSALVRFDSKRLTIPPIKKTPPVVNWRYAS